MKPGKKQYWRCHHDGYIRLLIPLGNGKYRWIFEHRYLMEKHLGRKLARYELVHHKNENKIDNRIENLQVVTLAEHRALHKRYKGCQQCGDITRRNITINLCENCYRRKKRKEKTGTANKEEIASAWGCMRGNGLTKIVSCCIQCHTKSKRHLGHGLCVTCYMKKRHNKSNVTY